MTVEYNVVIVGSDAVARYAAEYARSLNARVALITRLPEAASYCTVPTQDLYTNTLTLHALRNMGQAIEIYRHGPHQAGSLLLQAERTRQTTEPFTAGALLKSQGANQNAPASPTNSQDLWDFTPPSSTSPTPQRPNSELPDKTQASPSSATHSTSNIDWSTLLSLVQTLVEDQCQRRSLASLETMGVDVVYGGGVNGDGTVEFCDRPLSIETSRRSIPAQAYVIAETGNPIIPTIPGIEDVQYDTLDTFFDPTQPEHTQIKAPESVLIFSTHQGLTHGIETAYCLATLGRSVTLVTDQVLLASEMDTHHWVMTALVAAGVNLFLNTTITQIEQKNDCYIAQLRQNKGQPTSAAQENPPLIPQGEATACNAERFLLITSRQVDFTTLKLSTAGVKFDTQGVQVNSRYQSSKAQIFAIGDAIGSSPSLNQRYAEAAIAIHHALFDQKLWSSAWLSTLLLRGLRQWINQPLPNPGAIANVIHISPPLASIGFTEPEAIEQYGSELAIFQQSYQELDQAQLLTVHFPDANTGKCKILVRGDGQIVGATVWGIQAEEVIGAIALAMQQSIPIGELSQVCPPMPSITAELFQKLGMQWERNRLERRSLLFDWIELVLNWQRDWTKQ